MTTLAEVVKDPNFVNANPATKKAIFDKWAPQDPNYSSANEATKVAIRRKYGLDTEAPVAPAMPIAAPVVEQQGGGTGVPAWGQRYPRLYGVAGAAREVLGPLVEGGASIAGGLVGGAGGGVSGTAIAPGAGTAVGAATGAVAGAGLGYGIGKQITRLADQALGNVTPPTTANAFATAGKDVITGAAYEAGGRGIVAPAITGVVNYASKVKNLKLDAYLDAAEGRGKEILAALRAPTSRVPGSAPTAGEAAANVSGAKFQALQDRAKSVPEVATKYAEQAAQTNQARIAQEGRVASRFRSVADRVKAKIDRGLVDVSQKETGEALASLARGEQEAIKANVIRPAYERAFELGGNVKTNINPLVSQAEEILGRPLSSFSPETAPNIVRAIERLSPKAEAAAATTVGKAGFRIAKPGAAEPRVAEATLRQLDDLRKAINSDIAAAKVSTDPSAQTTLRNLGKLHDSIDEMVQGSTSLSPEAKTAYNEALKVYREQYVPRFKTGVNANMFKTTGINEQKILPDDVVMRYFAPNGEREAGQFVEMFGKNSDAIRVARAGIEDLYRRKVTDAVGNVVPGKAAQFMKDYARPIEILDNAGMNLSARFDIIAKDAARLAKIQEMATASGNKLAPALPPGANAAAVERRISELTKGLTPRQLADVNAVRLDIAREVEAARLAAAGQHGGGTHTKMATEAGKEAGLPLPMLLSTPVMLFNNAFKRLTGKLDAKLALEIAREMTSPAMTATSMEKALKLVDKRAATNAMVPPATRAAGVMTNLATDDSGQ